MWAGRCTPEASRADFPGEEGSRYLLPAAPPALVRREASQSSPGPGALRGRRGARRVVRTPAGPQVPGRAPRGAAAAHPAPQIRPAAPRSARRALGRVPRWGGARGAAAPSARPDRGAGEQARSWGRRRAGGASPCTHAVRAARSPALSGLSPWQPGAVCAPLILVTPGGSCSVGVTGLLLPLSRKPTPAGRCAPINSARVPASRSPGCARTEKVVRGGLRASGGGGRGPRAPGRPAPWN